MRLHPAALIPVVAALTILTPGPGAGQLRPFTFEVRGGLEVPLEELREADRSWAGNVGGGSSFSLDFAYSLSWYVAAYGGFGQHRFACPATGCGREADLVATGIDLGLRFLMGTGPVVPWLRGGVVSYRVEGTVPTASGPTEVVSSRAAGVEGGVGLAIRMTDRLTLTPGVRYVRMTPDFSGPGALPMRYLITDVGLVMGF